MRNTPLSKRLAENAIALICYTGILLATSPQSSGKPHMILVMADDQGYGDCGFTGHPFVDTPNLDAMANFIRRPQKTNILTHMAAIVSPWQNDRIRPTHPSHR